MMATSRFFAINVTAMAIIHYISSNCKHFVKKLCTNHIRRYILFVFLYFFPDTVTVTVIFIFFFNFDEVLIESFPFLVCFEEFFFPLAAEILICDNIMVFLPSASCPLVTVSFPASVCCDTGGNGITVPEGGTVSDGEAVVTGAPVWIGEAVGDGNDVSEGDTVTDGSSTSPGGIVASGDTVTSGGMVVSGDTVASGETTGTGVAVLPGGSVPDG